MDVLEALDNIIGSAKGKLFIYLKISFVLWSKSNPIAQKAILFKFPEIAGIANWNKGKQSIL